MADPHGRLTSPHSSAHAPKTPVRIPARSPDKRISETQETQDTPESRAKTLTKAFANRQAPYKSSKNGTGSSPITAVREKPLGPRRQQSHVAAKPRGGLVGFSPGEFSRSEFSSSGLSPLGSPDPWGSASRHLRYASPRIPLIEREEEISPTEAAQSVVRLRRRQAELASGVAPRASEIPGSALVRPSQRPKGPRPQIRGKCWFAAPAPRGLSPDHMTRREASESVYPKRKRRDGSNGLEEIVTTPPARAIAEDPGDADDEDDADEDEEGDEETPRASKLNGKSRALYMLRLGKPSR